ncbi:hypothetical protein GCM10023196_056780 [Actinoallomurus vinaceus]|uniref:Uncharacterized protein n=1 Tax=Actinoallomurus vinaceus TaxID=1080074 RepID=A0ABP8UF30_9ACTN
MTDPYGLQRAIDDYYRTLESLSVQGVSQLADLARLKVLIQKYPDHARQMITEINQPPTS